MESQADFSMENQQADFSMENQLQNTDLVRL